MGLGPRCRQRARETMRETMWETMQVLGGGKEENLPAETLRDRSPHGAGTFTPGAQTALDDSKEGNCPVPFSTPSLSPPAGTLHDQTQTYQ